MNEIIALLLQAVSITLVDIDNAMYSTGQLTLLSSHRRLVLILSLALELLGRLGLLWLFAVLTSEREPLFTLFGIKFTIESISLFAAGLYLLVSNARELTHTLHQKADDTQNAEITSQTVSIHLLLEMGLVLTVMSVDTVLVVMNLTTAAPLILFFLLFSAGLRLLFVDKLIYFVDKYPAVQVFILVLLILIGSELIVQAMGLDNELIFNVLLLMATSIFIVYQRRKAHQARG
ncbi:MAG: hypothetical protein GY796_10715 [Chloroflexi bacterium]|nr:hypothetical protein [Chloroflexota bacterium]